MSQAVFARVPLLLAVLVLLLFAGVAPAQVIGPEQPRTFRVPFHTVNGLILLDAKVNGKPAVLLLDTGANVTFYEHTKVGAAIDNAISIELEPGHFLFVNVRDMGLVGMVNGKIPKEVGRVDGILGNDALLTFKAVRIDYKNHVVELEK